MGMILGLYGQMLMPILITSQIREGITMECLSVILPISLRCLYIIISISEPIVGFEWLKNVLKPQNLIYIGLRDVDEVEREKLHSLGIEYFSMDEIIEQGIGSITKSTIERFRGKPVHISFDIDAIDPEFAHGTGTLVYSYI